MIVINKIVVYTYFHKICMVRGFWDTLYIAFQSKACLGVSKVP